MKFGADEYMHASLERIRQAGVLFDEKSSYALSIYCAGVAVESLLRAFRLLVDKEFDEKHDIKRLCKASRLLQVNRDSLERRFDADDVDQFETQLQAAVNEVAVLWHNNLRYASEVRLKKHLKELGRLQWMKGDPLRSNARVMLEAATTIVSTGSYLWNSRKK